MKRLKVLNKYIYNSMPYTPHNGADANIAYTQKLGNLH